MNKFIITALVVIVVVLSFDTNTSNASKIVELQHDIRTDLSAIEELKDFAKLKASINKDMQAIGELTANEVESKRLEIIVDLKKDVAMVVADIKESQAEIARLNAEGKR